MLIRFSVQNIYSFRDKVTFSMLPGLERLKPEHKSGPVDGISLLKTGLVYGANASGKSNLARIISFGKFLVLKGFKPDSPISYHPFKLDVSTRKAPSQIEYEIQTHGVNYAYGFVFSAETIKEEWLYKISRKKEIKIFTRDAGGFDLNYLIKKNSTEDERMFVKSLAKSTLDNQLFLNKVFSSKIEGNVSDISDITNVIDWFQNTLQVIFPDDKYNEGIKTELTDNAKTKELFCKLLKYFNTGVDDVCLQEVDLRKINIPEVVINHIKDDLMAAKSRNMKVTLSTLFNTYFIALDKGGEIKATKFMTVHNVKGSDKPIYFDTESESDGTNRIIDYIPVLQDLILKDKVFVIDEIERSLHPNLVYDIFKLFLTFCKKRKSQLIVSTHESSLLTQKLLRKDEIWFMVKDKEGGSHLSSLNEYMVRFDKSIRKDYLLGRFKGVPDLGNKYDIEDLFKEGD